MPETLQTLHGIKILVCAPDGKKLRTDRDAVELIGEAWGHEAQWVVIPTERLEEGFFELRNGMAGAVLSRFATYKMRVAVVGDISGHVGGSSALRAFVRESNRGNQIWFVAGMEEFGGKLAAQRPTA